MLTDKTIFIFGIAKYDGQFESTSYTTAKFLAKDNDVYYIDYPYTIKDYFNKRDDTFSKRQKAFFSLDHCLISTETARLKILILPPLLSINFLAEGPLYRFLLDVNEKIIVNRVKGVLKKIKVSQFVFINSHNFHYPNVGPKLNAKLSVYHCVDPLVIDYDRKHGVVSEAQIVASSDVVICTSRQLYREKLVHNVNTYFIPNAADITHSSKVLNEDLEIHPGLRDIPHPIVGYLGNIERRIDFDLLTKFAEDQTNTSLVLVGPVVEEYIPKGFRQLKNVYFIDRVPYEDMPSVVKGFDVAIIPFKKDEVSATIFPLKLFEYLGSGKPTVLTDFNLDLMEFTGSSVFYCKDSLEFITAIKECIDNDTLQARDLRVAIAKDHTWEKVLLQFSTLLQEFYEKKNTISD
ncbi:MAG: glycosyltransferase [Pedobacter sp.]